MALLPRDVLETRKHQEIVDSHPHLLRVARDDAGKALPLRARQLFHRTQQLACVDDHPDAVLDLVRDGTVERLQPPLAFRHLLVAEPDEVNRRHGLDAREGVEETVAADQQFRPVARHLGVLDARREEVEQDAAEQHVVLQDVVRVETLGMPVHAQLHRRAHGRRVDAHGVVGVLEIPGDPVDEERHHVAHRRGWAWAIRVALRDLLKPAMDKLEPCYSKPIRERIGELALAHWFGEQGGGHFDASFVATRPYKKQRARPARRTRREKDVGTIRARRIGGRRAWDADSRGRHPHQNPCPHSSPSFSAPRS